MIDYSNLLTLLVDEGEEPAEVVPEFYRAMYPDLAHLTNAELQSHFQVHGRHEGRSASPCDHRKAFLARVSTYDRVLEIGPFTAPAIRGPNVQYFDVIDNAELLDHAKLHGYPVENLPHIHFVSKNGDLSVVEGSYSLVYSSHCIEHTPDLLTHLNQVTDILEPGGRYLLTVPDRRYCFDHFRRCSALNDLREAYQGRRRQHTIENIEAYCTQSTHNDALAHWRGCHGEPDPDASAVRWRDARTQLSKGEYVDVHAWFFTPESFRTIMDEAHKAKLTPLYATRVYNTIYGANEFNAILMKPT